MKAGMVNGDTTSLDVLVTSIWLGKGMLVSPPNQMVWCSVLELMLYCCRWSCNQFGKEYMNLHYCLKCMFP